MTKPVSLTPVEIVYYNKGCFAYLIYEGLQFRIQGKNKREVIQGVSLLTDNFYIASCNEVQEQSG